MHPSLTRAWFGKFIIKGQESILGIIGYVTICALILGAMYIQLNFYESKEEALKPEALALGQEAMSVDDMLSLLTTLTSILGPLVASIIGYYFQVSNSSGGQ